MSNRSFIQAARDLVQAQQTVRTAEESLRIKEQDLEKTKELFLDTWSNDPFLSDQYHFYLNGYNIKINENWWDFAPHLQHTAVLCLKNNCVDLTNYVDRAQIKQPKLQIRCPVCYRINCTTGH